MKKAIFHHADCPVCISAEEDILNLIPKGQVEVIHLGTNKANVKVAENTVVKSVPALVLTNGNVLHINFGASVEDLK
ncbi:thioredoxin family protein [Dysgonomonas mossii]|uniref:Thioredoxin family protein n=1 Tax=Dysgonomonas mossii TaxID=163665 RepID=A0A4Y9IJ43_9BACT|nr:thioredoxin family protein [Dysgonomonas mossii]